MLFVDGPGLVFVHIEKTGGTSMRRWLVRALARSGRRVAVVEPHYRWIPKGVEGVRGHPHRGVARTLRTGAKLGFSAQPKHILTTIRFPYSREVSSYVYRRTGERTREGFTQFVRGRGGYSPYRAYLADERGQIHPGLTVIRLEDVDVEGEALKAIVRDLGGDPSSPFPRLNTTKHHHWRKYYTRETARLVAKKYAWTFEQELYERFRF
jgi:hypothetical protein